MSRPTSDAGMTSGAQSASTTLRRSQSQASLKRTASSNGSSTKFIARANDALNGDNKSTYGFLTRMWDDLQDSSIPAMKATPLPIPPSMRYDDVVERALAKPTMMSSTVSTDYAPLPTRTAAPTFTYFSQQQMGNPMRPPSELSYAHHAILRQKYDAKNSDKLKFSSQGEIDERFGINLEAADSKLLVAPNGYREVDVDKALRETHVSSLMDAITKGKREAQRERHVGRWGSLRAEQSRASGTMSPRSASVTNNGPLSWSSTTSVMPHQ